MAVSQVVAASEIAWVDVEAFVAGVDMVVVVDPSLVVMEGAGAATEVATVVLLPVATTLQALLLLHRIPLQTSLPPGVNAARRFMFET